MLLDYVFNMLYFYHCFRVESHLLKSLYYEALLALPTQRQPGTTSCLPAGLMAVLVCGSTRHKARVAGEEGASVEELLPWAWPAGKFVRHFLDAWLVWEGPAHYRRCHPWAGGPGHYQKARDGEQASKQRPSTGPASAPA